MHENPAADWQALAENYRQMYDEELERLADEIGALTETAQQVLRAELKNRGLAEPGARRPETRPPRAPIFRSADSQTPFAPGNTIFGSASFGSTTFSNPVDPDAAARKAGSENEDAEAEESGEPREYTWRTLLCECETVEAALQLREHLKRAGIPAWLEDPGGSGIGNALPRVMVAADELEDAIEVARQPIPPDILDDSTEEVPEYAPPVCPACGAEDPVLEAAEPTNSWLCEVCGKQWTEPEADQENEDN